MAGSGIKILPADLYHLFMAELSARYDFPSLYNCIVSSKHLASAGAVAALYRLAFVTSLLLAELKLIEARISHESPVKGGGSETVPLVEQGLTVQKWSILWRTVILSALGKTFFPYCRYLRMLDLRDLGTLLDDDKFRGKVSTYFFSGELKQFHTLINPSVKQSTRSKNGRLDIRSILSAIGDKITQEAHLLEGLTEPTLISNLLSTTLSTWAPRFEHLQSLELWDGKALADETVCNLLHLHCPNLQRLSIYQYADEEADRHLAAFIGGRPQNTITYFQNLSNCGISSQTIQSLNRHGESLKTLKLGLMEDGVLALGKLRDCKSLEYLEISSFRPSPNMKATQHDVFLEIVEWLNSCKNLRDISLNGFVAAPDLLTPILLNRGIVLENLQIAGKGDSLYVVKDHHDFHQALGQQLSLRRLLLNADPEPATRDDIEILMNAFCSLKQLRELNLSRISEYFTSEHIELLAQHLPNLEDLIIGGYGISDSIWNSLAHLTNLKTASFTGITRFTIEGILEYIDKLGDGNRGLSLSVDSADPDFLISLEGQDIIREALMAKVDGEFAYTLLRDPNAPEFDSSDSD